MKRAQKGAKIVASLVDLKLLMLDFTQPLRLMPPSGTEVAAQERATAATSSTSGNLIHVPMECATYDTEGICLTGPMQLKWVEQLLERASAPANSSCTLTASTNFTTAAGCS